MLSKADGLSTRIERSLYSTNSGELIAVSNSRLYPNKTLWYSCTVGYFKKKGVRRVCFVVGTIGILLVPIRRMVDYLKNSSWRMHNKGKSYFVRIKLRDNRFILFGSESEDVEVTDCFLPYK